MPSAVPLCMCCHTQFPAAAEPAAKVGRTVAPAKNKKRRAGGVIIDDLDYLVIRQAGGGAHGL